LIAAAFAYDPKRFEFDEDEECYGEGVVPDSKGAILTPESMITTNPLDDENLSDCDDLAEFFRSMLADRFKQFFIGLIVDATRHSIRILSSLGHLGPIREIPERSRRLSFKTNSHSWYRGQAAWQRMLEEVPAVGLMSYKGDRRWGSWEMDLRGILAAPYVVERIGIWTTCENWWTGGDSNGAVQRNLELVLRDMRTDTLVSLEDVGVGISQVIPVIVAARDKSIPILFVEQPELHLHPKQQAMLGDLFASQSDRTSRMYEPIEGKTSLERTIMVETHSELFILRLLRLVRETNLGVANDKGIKLTPRHLKVYYVGSDEDGTTYKEIQISDTGKFIQPWPDDFFELDFQERFA
jgi:hypothetical protein